MAQLDRPPFIREPPDVYRSKRSQYLTSHQLIDFRQCPALYHKQQAGLVPETIGDYYLIGAATHCLVLEGRQEFERQYFVGGPINPQTEKPFGRDTKAYAAWEAEQTKACLSDEQFALCCELTAAVRSHTEAMKLLAQGEAEGVLRTKYCGVDCQIRVDWFNQDRGLIDLKTCSNLDDFERDIELYNYLPQMAFYRDIITVESHEIHDVRLIAVEKREPFRVGIWKLDADDLDYEAATNCRAIGDLTACRQSGKWPTHYEQPRTYKRAA